MSLNRSGAHPESTTDYPSDKALPSHIRDALDAVPALARAQSRCKDVLLYASDPAGSDPRPVLIASTGPAENVVDDLANRIATMTEPFLGTVGGLTEASDADRAVAVYPIVDSRPFGWLVLLGGPSPDERAVWQERARTAASVATIAAPALRQWSEHQKIVSADREYTSSTQYKESASAGSRRIAERTHAEKTPTDAAHWKDAPARAVLSSVFGAAPFLFCIFDVEGRLLDVNAEVERLSGYRRDDLPDTRAFVESVLPDPEERKRAVDFVKAAPSGWISVNVSTAEGETVATRWACTELPGEQRLAVGFDDSENEAYQRALRTERDRLAMLFQSLPTPVVHGIPDDAEFLVHHVNPAFESVFGVEASEIEGHDLHDWIVPEERAEEAATINRQVVRGTPIHAEVRRLANDGERDFRVHAAIRSYGEEGVAEAYAIYTDISDHKAYERKLRRAKERAEDAARLKSAMLANMSHEVRTPLTAIIGFSEILCTELDADAARFAENIRQSSHRLMNTLDSVLELSKLDAGAYLLRRTDVDIPDRVRGTIEMMQPMAETAGVSLSLQADAETPLVGSLDAGAVDRVVTNLISNALKFTPEGGDVRVRVDQDQSDDEPVAVVMVEDNGVGIKSEFLPNLFDAFRQESDGMRRTHEGAGLGLTITRRLTQLLGGTISVESEKGEGTCFTVRFPLRASSPTHPPARTQPVDEPGE